MIALPSVELIRFSDNVDEDGNSQYKCLCEQPLQRYVSSAPTQMNVNTHTHTDKVEMCSFENQTVSLCIL